MGATDNTMISRSGWVLALWLSSALEEAEREAVMGDLAESGENGVRALANVLGLLMRREAAVWSDSRAWVVIFAVVVPLSFMLCTVARDVAGESAVYTWMYANNWDWALTKNGGFWYVFGGAAMRWLLDCLMVACWSWSAGVLLGSLRRGVQPSTRVALLLLLALFQIANAPQHWFHFWMVLSGVPSIPSIDPNAPVTASVFYGLIFPPICLAILVVLPAIWGMRQLERAVSGRLRVAVVFGACVSVMTMLFRVPPGLELLLGASGREWVWHHRDTMRLLPLIAYWPALYVTTVAIKRFWQSKTSHISSQLT